jgi:predicted small secreted protein
MRRLSFLTVLLALFVVTACDNTIDGLQEADLFITGNAIQAIASDGGSVNLLAGQSHIAGTVNSAIVGDELVITYVTGPNWCLYETHLHIASSKSGLPTNRSGNPVPGRFMKKDKLDCEATKEYRFPLADVPRDADGKVYVAAHAVVKGLGDADQCELIYGITQATGDIYRLNPLTWNATLLFSAGPDPTGNIDWPNTLGFDEVNGRLYFAQRDNDVSFYDFETGSIVAAGKLLGNRSAGATFADGKLYYIPHNGPDNLREVTFKANGTIDTDLIKYSNISGVSGRKYIFGDLAHKDGVIYFSARQGPGGPGEFASVRLSDGLFTSIKVGTDLMQLAFNWNSTVLYGHVTSGTGEFYEVDWTTGEAGSPIGNFGGMLFNDLAEGTTDCPTGEETAWGAGTRFRTPGNWGTYFQIQL